MSKIEYQLWICKNLDSKYPDLDWKMVGHFPSLKEAMEGVDAHITQNYWDCRVVKVETIYQR